MALPFLSHSRRLTTGAVARALRRGNPHSTFPRFSRKTPLSGSVLQEVNPDQFDLLPAPNLACFFSFPSAPAASKTITTSKTNWKLHPFSNWELNSRTELSRIHVLALPNADSAVVNRRPFSSATEGPSGPTGNPGEKEFRHQEIEGPTVELDNSALANETRQVLEGLRKALYDLSTVLALLAAVHLAVGAWIATQTPTREVSAQGVVAFAFPFATAFLMRRTLRPLGFFTKMEQQGRLQVLTLALQVSKHLRILFLRVRVLAICCAAGVSVGSVSALWGH